jgi:O-antigen ligase
MLRTTPAGLRPGFGGGAVDLARRTTRHLASFEMVFALYLCSNQLKLLFPPMPADETVVLAALSMPIGLAIILREGIYLRGLTIVAAGLLLFGWAALSWGWSPSRTLAKQTLSYLFTFDLWCLVTGALIIAPSRERARRLLALLLIAAVGIAAYGMFIFLVHGDFRFFVIFEGVKRAYLSWGYLVANGAIIAFALSIFSPAFSLRQAAAGLLLALCIAFLLVGSGRGPLIAVVLACLVALAAGLPQIRRHRIWVPKWQLIALAVLIGGGGYVAYLASTGTSFHTFNRLAKLLEQMQNPDVVQGANRFDYFATAIEMWQRSPIIGNGIASFSLLYQGFERAGSYPHNIVLEVLSELGVVGLALLLLCIAAGVSQIRRAQLRHDPLLLCVVMLFAAQLLAAMVKSNIAGQEGLFLFLGLLALRPAAGRIRSASTMPGRPAHADRGAAPQAVRGAQHRTR